MEHHAPAPPVDEPKTPLGLTLLGISLFLAGAMYWVASAASAPEEAPVPAAEAAAPAEAH